MAKISGDELLAHNFSSLDSGALRRRSDATTSLSLVCQQFLSTLVLMLSHKSYFLLKLWTYMSCSGLVIKLRASKEGEHAK